MDHHAIVPVEGISVSLEQRASVMLKSNTVHGDPVELGEDDLERVIEVLQQMLRCLRTAGVGSAGDHKNATRSHTELFDAMLVSVVNRPGVYVGRVSIRDVSILLTGYELALSELGYSDPLPEWIRWVEMKFLISHPAWHWTRILLHVFHSDRAALDALPALVAEYRTFINDHGVKAVGVEHQRRFREAYSSQHHAPEETNTTEP